MELMGDPHLHNVGNVRRIYPCTHVRMMYAGASVRQVYAAMGVHRFWPCTQVYATLVYAGVRQNLAFPEMVLNLTPYNELQGFIFICHLKVD